MNTNAAKVVAILVVGSVVKALFDNRPIVHNHYHEEPKADAGLELVKEDS